MSVQAQRNWCSTVVPRQGSSSILTAEDTAEGRADASSPKVPGTPPARLSDCPGHFRATRALRTTNVQFGVSRVRGTDGHVFPQCQNCLMTQNSQTTRVHLAAVCQVVSIPLDSWLLPSAGAFIPVLVTNENSQIAHHRVAW